MITQEFNLNMIPDSAPVIVHCDQYDDGTGRLIIKLYKGTTTYSPSGTAIIQGMKPDGRGFAYDATLSGNTVIANLTEQMTAIAGRVSCQIVVSETSGRTGTFVFYLDVQKSALPADSDMSKSEYQIVEQAIEDSEAWAVGKRNGQPVTSEDETYHNNAKYYAEQAAIGHVVSFNGRQGEVTPQSGDYTAAQVGAVASTEKGANNGIATLDSAGKVPSSQLPSYVDDVIEGYYYNSKFYKESYHTTEITAETGKIYVDIPSGKTYRWSGTAYTKISDPNAMETDGSNASNSVIFSGSFTVGSRASGSTVGTNSLADGLNATASGNYSHAEGSGAKATANSSHAEGLSTQANASASHAEGAYTVAGYAYQHVSGKYNDNKSTTLFEVGNGTGSSAKSNALEVYSNGDLNITGEYKKNGSVWTPNDPNISDAWASGNLYVVGVYRIYNNTLYKCNTEHTSTSSNYPGSSYGYWTAVKVGDELASLNSGLTDIKNLIGYPIIANGVFIGSAHMQATSNGFTQSYDSSDSSMWLYGSSTNSNDGYITPLPEFSNYTLLRAILYTYNGDSSIDVGFTSSTNIKLNTFLSPYFIDDAAGWHIISLTIPSNAAYLGIHIANQRGLKINRMWLE